VATEKRDKWEDRLDRPKPEEQPKVAKGKAPVRSDAELDALATVSTSDIRDARTYWKANTLPGYQGLIEATQIIDDDTE
jgi:hypothetical protein